MNEIPKVGKLEHPKQKILQELAKSKQKIKALKKVDSYYKAFFNATPDGVVIMDPSSTLAIEFNDKACSQLGYSRDEFAKLSIDDYEVIETAQQVRNRIQKIARDKYDHFETQHRCKNGKLKNIQVTINLINMAGIEVYHCIFRDVTENKQSAERLRESEEKFRSIFVYSPDAMTITRFADGYIVDCNESFALLSGYAREEVIGQTSLGINIWHDIRDRRKLFAILNEAGFCQNLESVFRKKDGSLTTVLISANKILLKGELQTVSVIRDVSERKQAEERLLASQTRFKELAELLPGTIFEMDLAGKLTYVNLSGLEKFGYTQEDLTKGVNPLDMIVAEDRSRAAANIGKIINQQAQSMSQYTAIKKDGTTFPVLIKSGVIIRHGKYVGLRGIIFDITEKQQLEEKLRQSQKMQAIGTLAGGIAHDFNNILSPLMGFAEILQWEIPTDSHQHTYIDKILQSALRAKDLVSQILLYSRQADLQAKPLMLQPIVKETFKLLRSSIPKTIELIEDVDSKCGAVIADPTQIHQIVMNLATNAFHAMEETGGRLTISLNQVNLEENFIELVGLTKGQFARITVTDTGVGMSPEVIEKIFDPYFTTKSIGKGTGLGLSVVQGIVESSNGKICVESSPGAGARIDVFLPIIETDSSVAATMTNELIMRGNERILVIDDEENVVKMEQTMLEQLGYCVTVRTASIEGLEAFKADPDNYDLVMTDMTMPNMSGDKLAKRILEIRPTIPVIICSGFSDNLNDETAKAMGLAGFLAKPIIRSKLSKAVRNALDSRW